MEPERIERELTRSLADESASEMQSTHNYGLDSLGRRDEEERQ